MSKDKLKKVNLNDDVVFAQWALFADEYNIPDDSELTGSDPMTQSLKQLKTSWMRMIRGGFVEIVEDISDGVLVKQFLSHRVEGISGEPQCLVYHAPTVATVSQARGGTKSSEEMPSAQRYLKFAASATNVAEALLYQLKGGDQSRMLEIAQLFLIA